MNYIGIDISDGFFHSAKIDKQSGKYQVREWAYKTDADLKHFTDSLDSTLDACLMEATGVYHLSLAYYLVEQGFKVYVVNPLSIKRYRQMKQSISKTDKQDAIFIAAYAVIEAKELRLFQIPDQTLTQLKQRRMLLNQLQKQLHACENELHALSRHPRPDSFTVDFLRNSQQEIKTKIKHVQEHIHDLIEKDYGQQKELLLTIPGFGESTANTFIQTVNGFEGLDDENASKAFAKFVGLAPSITQSGSSVRKQSTIARSGAPLLRQKLFLPAVTICMKTLKDNPFKTFFLRLRANGKSFKEAIVAVMHKMVRVAIAILKSSIPYKIDIAQQTK